MDISLIRTFFLSTTIKIIQIIFFLKVKPQVQLPETTIEAGEAHQFPQPAAAAARLMAIDQRVNQDLTMIAISFCLASAIDIALLTIQIKPQLVSSLPLLSMLIFFAFGSLLVGRFIYSTNKFQLAAQVMERLGIFLAAVAFCYAINIPFPLSLKFTTWAIFALSLLAIFICHLLF